MVWIIKTCKRLTPALVLFAFLAASGCEGTDTREKIDDTVEEFAGKKSLDRMEQMKKNLDTAQEQQEERINKTQESAKD